MSELQANEFITGEARLSYLNILEPKQIAGVGDPKFSVKVLIPKTDQATIDALKKAMQSAIQKGITEGKKPFGDFSEAKIATMRVNLEDGDVKYPDNPECKGHWCLNAKANAKDKPGILVQKGGKPTHLENPTDIYSGMKGMVHLQLYAYNTAGNAGVGVGLINILKTNDDEPLGGAVRKSAEDVFGAPASPFDNVAPAAGTPAGSPL